MRRIRSSEACSIREIKGVMLTMCLDGCVAGQMLVFAIQRAN